MGKLPRIMTATHRQQIELRFDYPVVFLRGLFATANPTFRDTLGRLDEGRRHRVLAFIDSGVAAAHPGLSDEVTDYCRTHAEALELVTAPLVVPGGEVIKNDYRLLMEAVDTMLEYRMCRQSFVVAIGGGAVLDAIGLGVSLVHRGLRMVRVPSTVLSQCDSAVGVKTGMNLHGGKNTIGTFHPPFAVLNDYALLQTLEFEDWIGGVSEAFKVAIIKDAAFLHDLCTHAPALRARDAAAMEVVVEKCALMHLEHIRTSGDPFELGRARPLDFGHWAAHKVESMTNYRIGHGRAVAIGVALDTLYAARQGWITRPQADGIVAALGACGFDLWDRVMDRRLGDGALELLQGLDDFRQHLGGDLCVTMPAGIGAKQEVHEMDLAVVEQALEDLRTAAAHPVAGGAQPWI